MQVSLTTTSFSYEVDSDASAVGYFAYLVGGAKVSLAARAFNREEVEESSTWRELSAVWDVWTNPEVMEQFQDCKVAHYNDIQAVASFFARGSRHPKLHLMVMEVALAPRRHGIVMETLWRSREDGLIE